MSKARFSLLFTLVPIVFIALGLIYFPFECKSAVKDSLTLCYEILIPSLFPFFVLSNLIISTGLAARLERIFYRFMKPLFCVSGVGSSALILGLIGGYPIGASCAVDLYKKKLCSKSEAERLLAFCNNSGPAFIFGAVGIGIFSSPQIGFLLYVVHALSALLVGIVFRFYGAKSPLSTHHCSSPQKSFFSALPGAIRAALQSTLNVCSFVIFFGTLLQILKAFHILPQNASILSHAIAGCFEITTGLSGMSPTPMTMPSCFVLASFLLAFSGVSILAQTLSFLSETDLSPLPCIAGKILHAFFAASLAFLILQSPIFPHAKAVFAFSHPVFSRFTCYILACFLFFLVIPIKKYWKKRHR